jgi:hypothetical protein
VLCQGPYEESARYRDFMGWEMPWYSAQDSLDTLLVGRRVGLFHLVSYLRQGSNVFETYWTTGRGVEAMDNSYDLLDMTVYGRQETWEDSPAGWPQLTRDPYGRTPYRPVAPPEGRVFGRPGRRLKLLCEPESAGHGCISSSFPRAFFGVSALLFATSTAGTIVWCASMSAMGEMLGGWTMSMGASRGPLESFTSWLDCS